MQNPLLIASALLLVQISVAEVPEEVKKIAQKCKEQHAITEDEMKGLKSVTIPESAEGKCFVGCMLEEMGVVVDGVFKKDAAEDLVKAKMAEKPEEMEKHLKLIEKCSDEVASHNDKCVTGPKIMECIKSFAPGFGIILPEPKPDAE